MKFQISTLAQLFAAPFDTIIDVRSPAEFAQDHMPNAINLPALDNDQRAEVGTIYVQEDPFLARKIGAAYVARNVANHIEQSLADKTGGWQPLIYCWRGGQRSGAFTTILQQIGWRAQVVEGGYQAYRRKVHDLLYNTELPYKFVMIDGGTGTGKTLALQELERAGAQVLDLEGAANHRGSLFGHTGTDQPEQKMFESRLAHKLARFDPKLPIFIEAESNKIGRLIIPPSLWKAMCVAPRVALTAPLMARAAFLVQTYRQLWQDPQLLSNRLSSLAPYHGHEQVQHWQALARAGEFTQLAAELVKTHYDPRYSQRGPKPVAQFTLKQITVGALAPIITNMLERF